MKRLLWVILGAIIVWFFARRRMDRIYGEVSRLREIERKYDALRKENAADQSSNTSEDDAQKFEERMAAASVDKKWRMAMLDALYRDENRESVGELLIDEDDS